MLLAVLCVLPLTGSARWYDASTGRFLSEDPLLGDILATEQRLPIPVSLQPWLYANGNPLIYTDPDGRSPNDRYGNLPPALQKACERGPSSCANAGYSELTKDCAAGNAAACTIGQGYVATVTAPALLFKPVILGWAAASLFSAKGHNPGDQGLVDPLTAGFEGTFGTAYQCGDDLSRGHGASMSCGLTAFNLVMLGRAGQMSRATRLALEEEALLARAGNPFAPRMSAEAAKVAGENAFTAEEFERLTRPAPVKTGTRKGARHFDDLPAVRPRSSNKIDPVESLVLKDEGFEGAVLDVPYIYVVDEAGQMSIAVRGSPVHGAKHTQLTGGRPAKAGGELVFGKDRTVRVNAQSGRYQRQSAEGVKRVADRLRESGYSPTIVAEEL
ncbi:hypothetical protein D7X74_15635 [Corallococcus sp. CA047B]|nr:hypothetical protein D7X74_15635 [Corallococcus sp. CA047B]